MTSFVSRATAKAYGPSREELIDAIDFFGGEIANVKNPQFGAVGDGATDDWGSIQAAIEFQGAKNGGIVYLPGGHRYAHSKTIDNTYPNVMIVGDGANRIHYVDPIVSAASSQLVWIGASGGTMVDFNSPSGASKEKMFGGGIRGVDFDANGLAGYGLKVRSWNRAMFSDLYFDRLTTSCIYLDVVAALAEAKDTQENCFMNITARTDTVTGDFINLNGDAAGNASMNIFINMHCDHKNGDVFVLNNCDNNTFIKTRAIRAAGGTGDAIVFNGSNDGAQRVARHNVFLHHSGVGGIMGMGTGTFTHPNLDNHVLLADKSNSTPDPTDETGSWVHYSDTNGHIRLAGESDATRGSAGLRGKIIFNTDDGKINIDNGTNWTLPDGSIT